jgi:hypothetical protein
MFKMEQIMKAMLLRIGIDKGTDGTLGPIFEDGSFEYIPISEGDSKSKEDRTYKNTIGRHGELLSTYLPKDIENRTMHFDPEFETFTYGDPTSKRKYLLKLDPDDLLVFYAGLTPFENKKHNQALYIIGYFTIEKVIDFNQLTNGDIKRCYQLYPNNAHLKRSYDTEDLVIVVGSKGQSKLLDKAILISKTNYNKIGRPYQAVSKEMETALGISGFIQRSIPPRFIRDGKNIDNLKKLVGF